MKKKIYLGCLSFFCLGLFANCTPTVRFARDNKVQFTRLISVPDEAVIYMQNLTLMRDNIKVKNAKHIELMLPSKLIVESLQLRSGDKILKTYNMHKKGPYTFVRVRNIPKYLDKDNNLTVEYLTWGIHWSAQYRVDLLEKGKIRFQLRALIQNHWANLSNMKLTLVAGWVGVSPIHRRFSHNAIGKPGRPIAGVGKVPSGAWPRKRLAKGHFLRQNRRKAIQVAGSYSRQALFSKFKRKYRIRAVDKTYRSSQSNFQKQFARYYKSYNNQIGANRVYGYALYHGVEASLQKNEQSFVRVSEATLQAEPYFLWPADRGEEIFSVYKVNNQSKFLFPAGSAWMYRKGVFIGQDICHWTPIGGSTLLTTSNDGSIVVRKQKERLKNGVLRTTLTIRNFAKKPVTVEVFERNPLWHQPKHRLRFSLKPLSIKKREQHHRWKLKVAAQSIQKIQMDLLPPPPVSKSIPIKVAPKVINSNALRRHKAKKHRPTPRKIRFGKDRLRRR